MKVAKPDSPAAHQQLALRIAAESSPPEREALRSWLRKLLEIRVANLPARRKAVSAIRATLDSRIIWPVVKRLGRETKRFAWDERTATARFGLVGIAAGIALFGGQTAGLAALGGAVAVPLWVVFGAGAAFARVLYDELTHERTPRSDVKSSADTLDARKDADGVHRT